MDFFKTPHIQIRFLGKNSVFKYEFLVIFIYPCAVPRAGKGVVTHQVSRLVAGRTGTRAGVQLHAQPILHALHKLRSPKVKT